MTLLNILSAVAENAKYMDSIAGKTEQLTNAMQSFWNDAINSDMIKYFLDLALGVTKVVEAFGPWKSVLAGVLIYFKAFKNIGPISLVKDLFSNIKNYAAVMQQVRSISLGSSSMGIQNINALANAVSGLSAKQQAAILTSQGFSKAQTAQVLAQNGVEQATIRQIVGQEALNASKVESISMTGAEISAKLTEQGVTLSATAAKWLEDHATEELTRDKLAAAGATGQEIMALLGLTGAASTATVSIKGLAAAMWTMMKSNPVGWIMMLVSAVMMLAPVFEDIFKSAEERMQELEQEFKELQDTIKTASDDFRTLKSSADEVIPRFAELAQGVDIFGKNVSLTDEEYKEFLSLNNKIADMFPEINNGMDSNGNAMLSLSFAANTLEESLWDLVEAERAAANEEIADTMPDVLSNISDTNAIYNEEKENIQRRIDAYKEAKEELDHLYSSESETNLKESYGDNWESYRKTMVETSQAATILLQEAWGDFGDDVAAEAWRRMVEKFTFEDGSVDWYGVLNSDEFKNTMAGFDKAIENVNDKIANKWAQLNPIVTAWTQTDYTFQGLSSEMQTVVQSMVGNLDFSALGLNTQTKVQSYIKNNILNKIEHLTPLAQKKFSELMSLDTDGMSTQAYIDKINEIAKEIEDMNEGWSVDDVLKNTGYKDIIEQYQKTVDKVADILGENLDKNSNDFATLKDNLYSLDPSKLTKAFDIIKKYGINTWDDLVEALENKTFDVVLDYSAEQEGIEKLLTAIEESISATGLSSESIENLKSRYQDLENYDPSRLFEETANGIHLNAKALRELESEYAKQNKTELDSKLKGLTEQYNELTLEIQDCSDAAERANLYAQRQNVLDQINDTATLAAQYEGLTSAYSKWQQIQSGGNERDMYEGVISGREEMDEEMARGWVDEGTRAYLEMLSGQDLSTAGYDKILEVYKKLNEVVNSSGYNVYDFFTQDEDGNSTTDGIFNFFDAVKVAQEEVGENWVKINEDGQYIFDFGEGGDKAVAEALGISEELVQIILRAAQDAGFEVNLDSTYSQLADFKDEVNAVNERLKELGATDYTFNINSTSVGDLETQITEAKSAIANLKNEDGTLKVGISEEDYQHAQTLLATLIYQKQTLDDAAILKVSTENAGAGIETIIQKLQQFKKDYNELEVKTAIGADTTEAKAKVDAAIASLNQEDKEILTKLGVDTSKSNEEINAAINNITPTLMVDCGLDTTLIEGYQEAEHTTDGEVVWTNNIDAVTEWMAEAHIASGTVEWDDDTSKLTTYYTGKGYIVWDEAEVDGTAHASGTAYAGGKWGAKKTSTSLVGELGPEILVRNGRWTTVGENGAEFTQVQKGDIIFNHKQSEELLKNGHVTGRGKLHGGSLSYASGTAYSEGLGPGRTTVVSAYIEGGGASRLEDLSGTISDASDAAEEFDDVLDWIEIRLEEINEQLDLMSAKVENALYYTEKNSIIDQMIDVNEIKMKNLVAGIEKYSEYAAKLLADVPAQYREAAQDGAIEITELVGEADEKTADAINKYREWAQKVADLKLELEGVKTEIRDLAKQKFDNAYEHGDVRAAVQDSQNDKLQDAVDYDEERGFISSPDYYKAMITNSKTKIKYLTYARDAMQKELDEAVKAGEIERGSAEWYEMIDQMYQIDGEIDEATMSIEEFQNAINDIYWDNFDELVNRIGYLKDETQGLIDIMGNEDMFVTPETDDGWSADQVEWSGEGMATLGLHAQNMEIAQYETQQYGKAIEDLNKDYADGKYSETEYLEKLNELTEGQRDSIEAYYKERDAIIACHKARVDEIKEGIEKQIEAYEELIDKKKEELDAEKDLYDWQKKVAESSKNISDIERKLAALSGDNSASAIAQRKKLEAELAEARSEQEDMYYERSIDNQHDALDKELENFKEQKEAEIEMWEEYLDDVEKVVADSLELVQTNATNIYNTLTEKAEQFDIDISDAILTPWKDGEKAVADYQTSFGTLVSSTTSQLDILKAKWQEVIDKMVEAAGANISTFNQENTNYAAATYTPPTAPTTPTTNETPQTAKPSLEKGSYVEVKPGTKWYADSSGGGAWGYAKSGTIKYVNTNGSHAYNIDGLGWIRKQDIQGYAHGTTSLKKSGVVNVDELGEELILGARNGRLTYLEKGTGIVPADVTANLMSWGALDPQDMLDRNRPVIAPNKNIINTEISLDCSVGTLVNIEHCEQGTLPDVEKIVNKALDKHMQNLNNSLKRFVR